MIERTITSTAAAPAQHPVRYQQALRRVAMATLVLGLPGAGALMRAWPQRGRVPRSWPPGVSR